MLHLHVLGSSAGGGFPQWNCYCHNCKAVRAGSPHFQKRTQSSIGVSLDKESWVLVNVSPDILQQLSDFPDCQLHSGTRGSKISHIILTDSQLDPYHRPLDAA